MNDVSSPWKWHHLTTTHITELYVPRGSLFSWLQVIDLKDIIAIRVPFLYRLSFIFKQRNTYTLVLDVISLNIPSGNDVNRLSKSVLKKSFDFCDKWYGRNLSPEKQMKTVPPIETESSSNGNLKRFTWNEACAVKKVWPFTQIPRMQQVCPSVVCPVYQKLSYLTFQRKHAVGDLFR